MMVYSVKTLIILIHRKITMDLFLRFYKFYGLIYTIY